MQSVPFDSPWRPARLRGPSLPGFATILFISFVVFLATRATECLVFAQKVQTPNIVFIMADDLGYGDLGCYGQKLIRTPRLDQMAEEGTRFTDCYAGSTICAPSRCVLMTGQHTGHTRVRGNMAKRGGTLGWKRNKRVRRMHLTDEDVTVAQVLQRAGYRTCQIGKWHLEGYEPTAVPDRRGFDQVYCKLMHDPGTDGYYPKKRYCNGRMVDVPGNQAAARATYDTDLSTQEAIDFIKRNVDRPFFVYLSYMCPHDPYAVPDLGPYAHKDWTNSQKTYAAMITHLDACVGRILDTLKQTGIDQRTIVFFCSDNGPRSAGKAEETRTMEFFDSNGLLAGYKRDMTEGGIRVPMIVRWPGKVPAGRTDDAVWYFADFLPTAAELAGVEPPAGIDGISVLPTFLGREQKTLSDRFLYWEYFERGFQQAVRWRNWKAIRPRLGQPLQLYDLARDVSESHDVAAQHPDVVQRIEAYLKTARTESENWPVKGR